MGGAGRFGGLLLAVATLGSTLAGCSNEDPRARQPDDDRRRRQLAAERGHDRGDRGLRWICLGSHANPLLDGVNPSLSKAAGLT